MVPQWLERLTGHQKVAGSIPVWGSEIVFLRIELDERSSLIQDLLMNLKSTVLPRLSEQLVHYNSENRSDNPKYLIIEFFIYDCAIIDQSLIMFLNQIPCRA